MIARCARCQGTFTTDRFGLQRCPHCGSELLLADPNAPPPAGESPPPEGGRPPEPPLPPPPPSSPPPGPPAGGAPPPGSWGPPGGFGPPGGALPPGGWGPPPPQPPRPRGPETPAPFAERRTRGFFASFVETFKLVATQPQEFFSRVRVDQARSAILFGVLAYTVGSIFQAIYGLVSGRQMALLLERVVENVPDEQARVVRQLVEGITGTGIGTAVQLVLTPLFGVVFIYVASGIVHVLLLLLRGVNRGFDATVTAVAYAFGLNLLLVVPACGGVVALVWFLVALVIGLGATQRCGAGKAAAAVFAPVLLACACACLTPLLLWNVFARFSSGGGTVDL